MTYGINIKNTYGETQIDSQYENYSLYDSGTWSCSNDCGDQSQWKSFSPTSDPPIIAIRPGGVFCVSRSYKKNSSGEYSSTNVTVECDKSTSIPYIVFSKPLPSNIPSNDYGISIYNNNSDLVFHSFIKWCKIVSYIPFSNPLNGDCSGSEDDGINLTVNDADNNYFILRPVTIWADYYEDSNQYFYKMPLMKRNSSTEIRVEVCLVQSGSGKRTGCASTSQLQLIEIST